MAEEVNKGGRPPGKENAITLLDRELRQTVKTLTGIRAVIEDQFNTYRKQLNSPDLPIETRLAIISNVGTIMTMLAKNVETLSKYTLGQAKQRERVEPDEAPVKSTRDDILNLLKGSK